MMRSMFAIRSSMFFMAFFALLFRKDTLRRVASMFVSGNSYANPATMPVAFLISDMELILWIRELFSTSGSFP